MKSIVHVTSVHQRDDTRIVTKEARTGAAAGYDTSLIVADGLGDATDHGVRIIDVGAPAGRVNRMLQTRRDVEQKALSLKADLYHLHDPELLPVAARLKRAGAAVIFDSHEDHVQDLLYKEYLPRPVRALISGSFGLYQARVARRLDAIVVATPKIEQLFAAMGCRAVTIANFPQLEEFAKIERSKADSNRLCYVGTMSAIRAFPGLIDAIAQCREPIELDLAGDFTDQAVEDASKASPGWKRVRFHGYVGREQVVDLLSNAFAGIVTLLPTTTHLESLPIKLFEYMAAGIPVIASNFPLWQQIVEDRGAGLCVDPTDTAAIVRAIETLYGDQAEGRLMGKRGQVAVAEKYSWQTEGSRLIDLYQSLIGR
jgi:glycosyltransferase involved in cell wall biosynthesis